MTHWYLEEFFIKFTGNAVEIYFLETMVFFFTGNAVTQLIVKFKFMNDDEQNKNSLNRVFGDL